jgi:hypothetical protein
MLAGSPPIRKLEGNWIPAFAGTTPTRLNDRHLRQERAYAAFSFSRLCPPARTILIASDQTRS